MTTDCIVIGGGHNGLVCAAYLARAGRSVLLEKGPWDKAAGAQRPYSSDDLLDEHCGRLTSESLHAADRTRSEIGGSVYK